MAGRKYTEQQVDEAMAMRERGLSFGQIARKTGMNAASVEWYCLFTGAELPGPPKPHVTTGGPMQYMRKGHLVRRYTPEEDEIILRMSLEGVPRVDIAAKVGRKPNSVKTRLATLARIEARQEAMAEYESRRKLSTATV